MVSSIELVVVDGRFKNVLQTNQTNTETRLDTSIIRNSMLIAN